MSLYKDKVEVAQQQARHYAEYGINQAASTQDTRSDIERALENAQGEVERHRKRFMALEEALQSLLTSCERHGDHHAIKLFHNMRPKEIIEKLGEAPNVTR